MDRTYGRDGFFEFDGRQGRPGAERAAHRALDVVEYGLLEALRPEVPEHHVLEVLEHGALLLPNVVTPQDLHERGRVPALEQLPLLLEHHVVELLVRRDDDRVPHQAGLEDWTIPSLQPKCTVDEFRHYVLVVAKTKREREDA